MFIIFKKERNELKRPNSLFQIKKNKTNTKDISKTK